MYMYIIYMCSKVVCMCVCVREYPYYFAFPSFFIHTQTTLCTSLCLIILLCLYEIHTYSQWSLHVVVSTLN